MATLDRLTLVIDAYGADPQRWPELERDALVALAAATPAMADALREARALDAVLQAAPSVDADRLVALHERILAQAGAGNIASTGRVTPMRIRPARPLPGRPPMWAAAALAASLFVGVLLGASDIGRPAVEELAGLAGIETTSSGGALDVLDDSDVELL